MKIDVFAHILPEKYLAAYSKKNPAVMDTFEARNRATVDMEMRFRLMDRHPEVLQVLTIAQPALESLVSPDDAVELARIANDELAELVNTYPDKFIAAVACLPMNNIDAALEEADRAITKLKLKGVQIYSRINGETLDNPKFKPLYEKMAKYDFPIWIHPCPNPKLDNDSGIFSWPFETASAMFRLVSSAVFSDYPDLKFIVHHCGSMIPYFEKRVHWISLDHNGFGHPVKNPGEHFRKFYVDTAVYGSTPALMCGHTYFGTEHLLFGTDAPLGPSLGLTTDTIASIENMDIPDADKEKIFLHNAVNLLKMPK